MEVGQREVINFIGEKSMKGVEIIHKVNKRSGWDALQRAQVCYWIKEVKSGRRDFSSIPPPERVPYKGLDDCTAKALKEDPRLSTRNIAKP
jgi:hypothetical protein